MSNADSHNSAKEIQIAAPCFIPNILHFAFDKHDGLFVEVKNDRAKVFLSEALDLIKARTNVRLRLMVGWGKFGQSASSVGPSTCNSSEQMGTGGEI